MRRRRGRRERSRDGWSAGGGDLNPEDELRERLRKIEALFAGAATPGERDAAEAARERLRSRLAEMQRGRPAAEMQFSMPDQWSRRLFVALCRRYGLEPYRYKRQRHTTVVLRASKDVVDTVLWPEFTELNKALRSYLDATTLRVIRDAVHADTSEAAERAEVHRIG